jgi:hypothetical protein
MAARTIGSAACSAEDPPMGSKQRRSTLLSHRIAAINRNVNVGL